MKKRMEMCPWCYREVWVEPERGCLYICTFCGGHFTFVHGNAPTTGESSPQPQARIDLRAVPEALPPEMVALLPTTFVETPLVRELVDRLLACDGEGLPDSPCSPKEVGESTLTIFMVFQSGYPVVFIECNVTTG